VSGKIFIRTSQLISIIESYAYPKPLHLHLKEYFQSNKKLGSRDRREIKAWFYGYFKSEYVEKNLPIDAELKIVLQSSFDSDLQLLKTDIDELNLTNAESYYPLKTRISASITLTINQLKAEKPVWIRARNSESKTNFATIDKDGEMLAILGNQELLLNKNDFQIQDWASCKAAQYCATNLVGENIWDLCAGAGGKTMYISDKLPEIFIYASDKRSSILENLKSRIKCSKIETAVIDLTEKHEKLDFETHSIKKGTLHNIIADVPCSGSGTWGRNPQHLRYFNETHLKTFTQIQNQIIKNALPFLAQNGNFFYITCSIYKDENEALVEEFCKKNKLKLMHSQYFLKSNADCLYLAHLMKINS